MRRLFLFLACFVFAGCTTTKISKDSSQKENDVALLVEQMTVREKIGQMLAVAPEYFDFTLSQKQIDQDKTEASTMLTPRMKLNFKNYPAGTIILFAKNIETPEQTKRLIASYRALSRVPLMICVDEEGGRVARIAKNKNFGIVNVPPALETVTEEKAEANGFAIGTYLSSLGFNADFAPVADVWTNNENTVIGDRAFSRDPNKAAVLVKASIKGFHKAGTKTAIKHFPGHGDTREDSHTSSAKSMKTWEQLKDCEMIPFKAGINAGTDMVMIAHIHTPNADAENLPATLSHTWITDRLRGELGFNGVVVTDAMGMKAISEYYESTKAAIMAINAGCDIILMPHDYAKVFDGIIKAVEDGTISEDRINESVERILLMKFRKY